MKTPAVAEILNLYEREEVIKPFEKPIYITRPFLPPFAVFCRGLGEIWENRWLTNNGPILQRFRKRLENFFETDNLCLFSNGTQALQIALRGLEITGEVITTPFTFVATAHSLSWNGIQPVFVDIEPETYTIDPEKVEAAITPRTTAILAVHVYGHPCRLEALADIARRHGLKLIYDAAHAFGIKLEGQNIGHYGDVSMFSFHATKLFHSIEGGMLIFRERRMKETFDYLKKFGFKNENEVVSLGTNAKMSEFQALMGIQVIGHFEAIRKKHEKIANLYRSRLREIPGIRLPPPLSAEIEYNYAYMPIEVEETEFGMNRDSLHEKLKDWNVFSRRYFYPLVCDYEHYRKIPLGGPLRVARGVAERILTLPIYESLELSDVETICAMIAALARGRKRMEFVFGR